MQQIKLSMTKFFVLCDTCWISFSRHATFLGLHVSCNHGLSRFTNILFVLIYNLTDTRQCNLFGKSFDLFLHKIFFRLAAGVNSTLHPILFCFFVFLAQIPGIHSNLTVFLVLNPSLVSFLRFTFFINKWFHREDAFVTIFSLGQFKSLVWLLRDENPYHTETSPLICSAKGPP